jgi:hypothetical protein
MLIEALYEIVEAIELHESLPALGRGLSAG